MCAQENVCTQTSDLFYLENYVTLFLCDKNLPQTIHWHTPEWTVIYLIILLEPVVTPDTDKEDKAYYNTFSEHKSGKNAYFLKGGKENTGCCLGSLITSSHYDYRTFKLCQTRMSWDCSTKDKQREDGMQAAVPSKFKS